MGEYGEDIKIDDPLFGPLAIDQEILRQAIFMRVNRSQDGILLTGYLQQGVTNDVLARIPFEVRDEVEKEDIVESCEVAATNDVGPNGARLKLKLAVTPRTGEPFDLVLGVDALTVEILTGAATS